MVRLGRSFPGFNLPTPLRRLDKVSVEKLTPAVENFLSLAKNKSTTNAALAESIGQLFEMSGTAQLASHGRRGAINKRRDE